jgi:hypothetical protein
MSDQVRTSAAAIIGGYLSRLVSGTFLGRVGLDWKAMKRSPTIFLQPVIMLIAVGAIAPMLWEPHIEGRNAHATLFEIYFKDPFLAYAYIGSAPFFLALYQAFKVLGYIGQDKAFSQAAVKALRTIKSVRDSDDRFCCSRRTFHYVGQ